MFINRSAKTKSRICIAWCQWLCVVAVLIAFSGCASTGGSAQGRKGQENIPEIEYKPGEGPPLVLLPNPYDLQKVKVAEDVKQKFQQGVTSMAAQKWSQAEGQFDGLTQTHPELSGPWVNLGICLWRQEQYEPASQAFEHAISANSLNGEAYVAYAVMAREQGQFPKAEDLYKKAINAWPHNVTAHRNLGVLYDMYMGRFDDALKHFEMAARIMGEPDKELKGWIVDIKRRQAKAAKEAPQPAPEQNQAEAAQ